MSILDKELTHADQDSEMLLYEQVEFQKQENAELRAQLAKAVDIITEISAEVKARAYFEATSDTKWIVNELGYLIEYLSGQAKADAEVLRCAEAEYERHQRLGIHDESYDCSICRAVRAAKGE
jgi:hypothetical protein